MKTTKSFRLVLLLVTISSNGMILNAQMVGTPKNDFIKHYSQDSGEITISPNHFYHGSHNYGEIRNLTIKWNFRTLFGEPVIDGVFKWEAGSNTPIDFLDYRDYVLLKCTR